MSFWTCPGGFTLTTFRTITEGKAQALWGFQIHMPPTFLHLLPRLLLALLCSVFSQVPLDLLALTQHFGSSIITSSLLRMMLFLQGRHSSSTKSEITKRFQAKFWGAVRKCLWTGSCCASQTTVYESCSSQFSMVSLASLCPDFPQNYVGSNGSLNLWFKIYLN